MKTYTFLLNFGYAEDANLSYLPYTSEKKFASTKAAFVSLAEFLKEKLNLKNAVVLKDCCKTALAVKAYYCCKCGNELQTQEFDEEEYMGFIRDYGNCSCNDSMELIDYDEDDLWKTSLPDNMSDVKIIHCAEKALAAAIGSSPDDRVSIDSIFKNHRKTNVFSFWD